MPTSTAQAQASKINVNVLTMTATYITNNVFNLLFRIINERGLTVDYINDNRKIIEDGLFTWVSEQSLNKLSLEVFQDGQEAALEKYNFDFRYSADPTDQAIPAPLKSLQELSKTLKGLPSNTKYRVVVSLKDGASTVPGWSETEEKDINVTKEAKVGGFGFGYAEVILTYQGGKW
jgi:hypothetical protein